MKLFMSHEDYATLSRMYSTLTRIRDDGTIDESDFITWVMTNWGLQPYVKYEIVVDNDY